MKFVTTRSARDSQASGVSLRTAMLEGLAPDGGLYVPEAIEPWQPGELARLRNRTLTEIAYRALRPYTRPELDAATCEAVVVSALNFPIPLVEVEPGIYALELFHGPTLAFKDVGARTMARLLASLDTGDQPLTVLAATSGDTGSAVAHAFHGVPHTRVVVLYPEGRVSPTQEAQLTMFNSEDGNVRAYAVAGSFDDCHKLTKEAFADVELRKRVRLTSANSVNMGRLLPQMVYYFHAVAQVAQRSPDSIVVVCTPSGNFGNLTAGLFAKRAGLPIAAFRGRDQCQRRRARVPADRALCAARVRSDDRERDGRRQPEQLRAHAAGSIATRWTPCAPTSSAAATATRTFATTIKRVYAERGYLLDPHSAISYMGLKQYLGGGRDGRSSQEGRVGIFLATAHPAKFSEIVEPIIGPFEMPAPLAEALAQPRHVLKINASFDAVRRTL